MATAVTIEAEEEEEPVEFDKVHYPNGLNADFFQENASAEDLIEKYTLSRLKTVNLI